MIKPLRRPDILRKLIAIKEDLKTINFDIKDKHRETLVKNLNELDAVINNI